jgi:hypothetical protein
LAVCDATRDDEQAVSMVMLAPFRFSQ